MPAIIHGPKMVCRRSVGEWSLVSSAAYANPFADVELDGVFIAPDGTERRMPAFYDGDGTWRIRFNPRTAGTWTLRTHCTQADADLLGEATFEVTSDPSRGFVQTVPGQGWGWQYESGEPLFILGDTVYNLFAMADNDGDVDGFLRRRAAQGFNLLRVRAQVSPYHPPRGYSDWQIKSAWPWGGSSQAPRFDEFNLNYFGVVDRVMQAAENLGIGFEFIMEAWGFEFPFCDRARFTDEYESMWMRWLVARYDAYNALAVWTLQNEYEYYPDGDWRYNPLADRWAIRRARWLKALAPHNHVVAVHNGPRLPPFARRFRRDIEAVDAIMFQTWGTRDEREGWLARGIEPDIRAALNGWPGAAAFVEWGYERDKELELKLPSHRWCDVEHTRRGAWRGAMCGLGICNGFEHSWGPWMMLDVDQPGLDQLLICRDFFIAAGFERLHPAQHLVLCGPTQPGHEADVLASAELDKVVAYLPTGGDLSLSLEDSKSYRASWFNPRSGAMMPTTSLNGVFITPVGYEAGHPLDWVLFLER